MQSFLVDGGAEPVRAKLEASGAIEASFGFTKTLVQEETQDGFDKQQDGVSSSS